MEDRIKHRLGIEVCLICVILLVLPASAAATNPKAVALRGKMGEILSLREGLIAKQARASQISGRLRGKMHALEAEIEAARRGSNIASYQAAMRIPRIRYNIKLIQKLLAYLSALDRKIEYLGNGTEKLRFLYRQAEDDLRILKTLNDMDIQKLIDEMTQTSETYQMETRALLIDADGTVLTPPEAIWRDLADEGSPDHVTR